MEFISNDCSDLSLWWWSWSVRATSCWWRIKPSSGESSCILIFWYFVFFFILYFVFWYFAGGAPSRPQVPQAMLYFARPSGSKHIKGRSREPFRKLVSLCTRDFLQKPVYNREDKFILAIGPTPEYLSGQNSGKLDCPQVHNGILPRQVPHHQFSQLNCITLQSLSYSSHQTDLPKFDKQRAHTQCQISP